MKVVCVYTKQQGLTYGKIYDVYPALNRTGNFRYDSYYFIEDDLGNPKFHPKNNFISLDEYRESQLNKLLKENV
jgi:hypothetical protein